MKAPIEVYVYNEAPEYLKIGSPDDADWLAVVPPQYDNIYIGWLRSGSEFGCCDVVIHNHPNKAGYKIYIGYHS